MKVAVEHNCNMISMSLGDTFATYLRHRKYIAFRSPCNIQEWNSFLTWLVVTTNSKQISRLIDPTSVTSFVYIDRLCRFNGAIANEVYLMHEHCWIFVKQILGLQPNSTTWFNIMWKSISYRCNLNAISPRHRRCDLYAILRWDVAAMSHLWYCLDIAGATYMRYRGGTSQRCRKVQQWFVEAMSLRPWLATLLQHRR